MVKERKLEGESHYQMRSVKGRWKKKKGRRLEERFQQLRRFGRKKKSYIDVTTQPTYLSATVPPQTSAWVQHFCLYLIQSRHTLGEEGLGLLSAEDLFELGCGKRERRRRKSLCKHALSTPFTGSLSVRYSLHPLIAAPHLAVIPLFGRQLISHPAVCPPTQVSPTCLQIARSAHA
ncbi:hypothetical protein Pcinc_042404 [Petrolisthes cinctipes]|uniref:Uncharacterized protein n=1 Tax=Petrolisthes cinctipes TaxID=88211 RepID=A0AAE1EIW5_PETCI|nr:hypothetical protein Pcinc_042404 [Petrolisthes cinctipes]